MAENRTNVEEIEVTEVQEVEKTTEITEVKEKKGIHPIKAAKEWTAKHPKATKVIAVTTGFVAGVAGTLVAIKKLNDQDDDEFTLEDTGIDVNDVIDGEFTVSDAKDAETTES